MTRLRALVFGLHANAYHSYYDVGLHLIRPQPYERNVGHRKKLASRCCCWCCCCWWWWWRMTSRTAAMSVVTMVNQAYSLLIDRQCACWRHIVNTDINIAAIIIAANCLTNAVTVLMFAVTSLRMHMVNSYHALLFCTEFLWCYCHSSELHAAINCYLLLLCGSTQQHSMTNDVLVQML